MYVHVCVCVSVHLLHNYAWILADIYIFIFLDNIFHLDVHYVCMLVQRFELQGRRFTNFHYYYYDVLPGILPFGFMPSLSIQLLVFPKPLQTGKTMLLFDELCFALM